MKLRLSILGLIVMFCSLFSNTAFASSSSSKGEKIYLAKEQIFSNNKQVLVKIGDNLFEAPCMHKDSQGLFVRRNEIGKLIGKLWDMPMKYKCSRCKQWFETSSELSNHRCPK